jgi:proprotein convertase subtilisin/kexin type 5
MSNDSSICVNPCPDGWYRQNLDCNKCSSECATCTAFNDCLTCSPGNYLHEDKPKCGKTCDPGYYLNLTLNKCMKCISPCKTCTTYTDCLTCLTDYFLYDDKTKMCS